MTILRTGTKKKKSGPPPEITASDLPEMASPKLRDRLLGGAVLLAATGLFLWFTVTLCRPLLLLIRDPSRFQSFIRGRGALGYALFLGIQILQGFLPIPLELTAIAGGYAFGRVQGTLLTLCSVVISTTIIFYFTKIFGHRLIGLFFTPAQQKHIRTLRSPKSRSAFYWVVFLIPGMPKRLFVFSAGLVPQDFRRFLLISTLARVPSLLACSFGGWALFSGNYTQAAVLFSAVAILSTAGYFLYRTVSSRTGKNRKQSLSPKNSARRATKMADKKKF
ncbi:TVP38/TMEM64 family protein [Caproiciproducens faecalis]|uniref:TVP38/TMEM64 family membrane protein n=1 Tax=Caproiciproducens faecalis TaxID=2820301 RepID=A0ABS7DQH1_9FIRM|nr:VTT domain-containing protein [Caproiciproducens faecalis]MBW7572821.1 TVP38/TMEM64 family protein [Caproiciproducens faecalis]